MRDGQVIPPGQHRITPRVAFVEDIGQVRLGIMDDGWSENRAMQADNSVMFEAVAHASVAVVGPSLEDRE